MAPGIERSLLRSRQPRGGLRVQVWAAVTGPSAAQCKWCEPRSLCADCTCVVCVPGQAHAQDLERSVTTGGLSDDRTSSEALVHFTDSQACRPPHHCEIRLLRLSSAVLLNIHGVSHFMVDCNTNCTCEMLLYLAYEKLYQQGKQDLSAAHCTHTRQHTAHPSPRDLRCIPCWHVLSCNCAASR